jgi:hypothetical protein
MRINTASEAMLFLTHDRQRGLCFRATSRKAKERWKNMSEHKPFATRKSYMNHLNKQLLAFIFITCLAFLFACGIKKDEGIVFASPALDQAAFNKRYEEKDHLRESASVVPVNPDEYLAAAQDASRLWGYVNTNGEWVIAPQYWKAFPFVEGLATVKAGTSSFEITGWQIIDINNIIVAAFQDGIEVIEPLVPEVYTVPGLRSSGSTIFEGTIIIAKDLNGDHSITSDDRYGLVDTSGKIILEPIYREIKACREGLIPVDFSSNSADSQGNWGYVNQSGEVVVQAQFGYALPFSDGVARVGSNDSFVHYGCIDTTGEWLFSTATLAVLLSGDFQNGIAPARIGRAFGIVVQSGAVLYTVADSVNSQVYIEYSPFGADSFHDGLFPIFAVSMPNTSDGFFPQGFIDMQGDFAIPAQTEWKTIQGFHGGLCCVFSGSYSAKDNLFGYIDKTGEVRIPMDYCKATMFNGGHAAVASGDRFAPQYYIIDDQGSVVATMQGILDMRAFTK